MSDAKLRAWWWHRQGLDGSLKKATAAQVLEKTGWARSVGGVGPYLTLFSRAGIGRQQADDAVARLEIHELPSAKGCTHVLPASDFALGLRVGQGFSDASTMNTARKLGVTDKEIEKLQSRILKALEKGPLDPEEIRAAVGDAARNLGDEGKKKGMITTLPVALGNLQQTGDIRRIPTNGRLDQQRYRYALWRPSPLAGFRLSKEEAYTELARRYFRWIAPATVAEFQWFSALGVKVAKAAIEPLGLVPFAAGDARLIFPADLEAFHRFKAPDEPRYALLSSVDALVLLRREIVSLVDKKDASRNVAVEKVLKPVTSLTDLPNHGIFDRGRLIGLWEYDPETNAIAWMSFQKADAALKQAVAATEAYIRDQVGDARSFSLDSAKSRAPRIAALRAAAG